MTLSSNAALSKDTRNARNPVMEHRHYAVIARIIAGFPDYAWDAHSKALIAARFADNLASTNPNFDRARFLRACGF